MTAGESSNRAANTAPEAPPDFVRYLNVQAAYGASFAPDGKHMTLLHRHHWRNRSVAHLYWSGWSRGERRPGPVS